MKIFVSILVGGVLILSKPLFSQKPELIISQGHVADNISNLRIAYSPNGKYICIFRSEMWDGEITASEIQAYVGKYVPRLTQGLQVPTFRQENLEYDFRVW